MDETQQSRQSDISAAATRKRRSSILKSQRPPRTPFSELEFHVATPTDTAKNRRVSFSRRTAVLEFTSNEAQTTWQNFYEEHNKSLESSGNESGANPPKEDQGIGHLGKRLFDQQFQDVEEVDLINSLDNFSNRNGSNFMNNDNFTQQLASLEFTSNKNVSLPQQHFEMSECTDHQSKVFGEDIAFQTMNEMSGKIDVNFSAIQTLDGKDDLDEIQQDVQRAQTGIVCPGPFERDLSEYIEIDLNATHVTVDKGNEESDMSITDTIHSPKVQEISKANLSANVKKSKADDDWIADKENIAVFDRCPISIPSTERRKTIVYGEDTGNISITQAISSNIIMPVAKYSDNKKTVVYDSDADISMTQSLPVQIIGNKIEKRKTIIYENETGNVSVTQAIPSNIILPIHSKTATTEDILGDISITQAVPIAKIITRNIDETENVREPVKDNKNITVFDNDVCNISKTQVIPQNIISNIEILSKSRNYSSTIKISEKGSSINLAISAKRKTIVFEDGIDNISMTKAVPTNIIVSNYLENNLNKSVGATKHTDALIEHPKPEVLQSKDISILISNNNRKTIIADGNIGESSVAITLTSPNKSINIISGLSQDSKIIEQLKSEVNKVENFSMLHNNDKRKTIVFEEDMNDISMTQSIPANIIQSNVIEKELDFNKSVRTNNILNLLTKEKDSEIAETYSNTNNKSLISSSPEVISSRRKTIVYEKDNDDGNMSITQAIPQFKIMEEIKVKTENISIRDNENTISNARRRTVVFEKDDESGNMSITGVIPQKEIIKEVCNKMNENHSPDASNSRKETDRRKTITYEQDNEDFNMSITEAVPGHIEAMKTNKTIVFDSTMDISITKTDKNNCLKKEALSNSFVSEPVNASNVAMPHLNQSLSKSMAQDVLVYQAVTYSNAAMKENHIESGNTIAEKEQSLYSINKSMKNESDINPNNSQSDEECNLKEVKNTTHNIIENYSTSKQDTEGKPIPAFNTSDSKEAAKSRQVILDNLLDMSQTSLENKTDLKLLENKLTPMSNKHVDTHKVDSENVSHSKDNNSIDLVNYGKQNDSNIMHTITNQNSYEYKMGSKMLLGSPKPLTLEYKEEKQPEASVGEIDYFKYINSASDRAHETKHSNKKDTEDSPYKSNEEVAEVPKTMKSFRDANDTNELLEMLSDLTDKSRILKDVQESRPASRGEQDWRENEPRRLSVAPKRQSMVLSREDLLNNISMAQAALQKSIDSDESVLDSSTSPIEVTSPKKSLRLSNEVVKKLHFEDESTSDVAKTDLKSLLKKTAFGESEFMKENKSKVIPSYLKDVSNEMKLLMNDLVKPNVDLVPFQATNVDIPIRDPSTCSTQIQANLITSSQIDIDTDGNSDTEINYSSDKTSAFSSNTDTKSLRSSLKNTDTVKWAPLPEPVQTIQRKSPAKDVNDSVIVFDPNNPLNNILIAPADFSKAHKYNPRSIETICPKEMNPEDFNDSAKNKGDSQNSSIVERVTISPSKMPLAHTASSVSTCKSTSVNDLHPRELRDSDINTVITMKQNKELLETSSSLTLVDDAMPRENIDDNFESADRKSRKSPVKLIYKYDDDQSDEVSDNKDSDLTSTEDIASLKTYTKGKKRSYSPTKRDQQKYCTLSGIDITPKPQMKMQRISNSPAYNDVDMSPQKLNADHKNDTNSKGMKKTQLGSDITVQQLITEYDLKTYIDHASLNKQILEALSRSNSPSLRNSVSITEIYDNDEKISDVTSSCASSKNMHEMKDASSVTTTETVSSNKSQMEWQADVKESTSRNLEVECESSVNVVAKIDMLTFMGSHICEWESWGTDTWSFRLLHGRLRLTIRLAHRHHNAARTRVRADTPILSLAVETAHNDKKNSVALLCVGFAAEAMQYFIDRGWQKAGEVPALLRRCACVARVALKWGRVMHDARLQLAYTLNGDGKLTLKVANIPLRSVWEVTMRLELAVEDTREVPWPRAMDVKVSRVVSDVVITEEELQKVVADLPRDWGHVPRTVWKIFRYLKNKTRDKEMLGL